MGHILGTYPNTSLQLNCTSLLLLRSLDDWLWIYTIEMRGMRVFFKMISLKHNHWPIWPMTDHCGFFYHSLEFKFRSPKPSFKHSIQLQLYLGFFKYLIHKLVDYTEARQGPKSINIWQTLYVQSLLLWFNYCLHKTSIEFQVGHLQLHCGIVPQILSDDSTLGLPNLHSSDNWIHSRIHYWNL